MSREERIMQLIAANMVTTHLSVENESHHHHVPKGSETHFKLLIVSEEFNGMSLINRHRKLNALLADELASDLHALTLHLYTEAEWERRQHKTQTSPACRDGYHHG
ncbi:BolA family protein [Legionella cardiaca]|uniref:BolA/IbaG family iron-sulfur metabolism protein n=1 Tax=Legionella cardiaca TaxID=1071983 RepID=A0ABY8ASG0_9GAMM|nr:BolA/IbaG family iron-sulfur metabolism protein [Legionella cardiaca]WED42117.1 BolA/IbaG family iron-sulfur metabolism protein [Legionella cardiaca]